MPGFVGRVLRFAVPAGTLAAVATMPATRSPGRRTSAQIEARTTATIALFIVALWVLAILARPTNLWRLGLVRRWRGLFVVTLVVPWSRHFFALDMARADDHRGGGRHRRRGRRAVGGRLAVERLAAPGGAGVAPPRRHPSGRLASGAVRRMRVECSGGAGSTATAGRQGVLATVPGRT